MAIISVATLTIFVLLVKFCVQASQAVCACAVGREGGQLSSCGAESCERVNKAASRLDFRLAAAANASFIAANNKTNFDAPLLIETKTDINEPKKSARLTGSPFGPMLPMPGFPCCPKTRPAYIGVFICEPLANFTRRPSRSLKKTLARRLLSRDRLPAGRCRLDHPSRQANHRDLKQKHHLCKRGTPKKSSNCCYRNFKKRAKA